MEVCFVIRFLSFTLAFKFVSSLYCNANQYKDKNGNCLMCPDHCQFCNSNDSCFTCINGYWGNVCEKFCDKCMEGTSCAKSTGFCNKDCKDGYTGELCDDKCNEKCLSCNRTNAHICLNCAHGWYPPVSCHKSCPDGCFNRSCSAKNVCTDGCKNGFYGQLCEFNCLGHCKDNLCHQDNGTCVFGCEDNYTGTKCDIVSFKQTEERGRIAATATVVTVMIVLVSVAVATGLIVYRKKRSYIRSNDRQKPEEQKEMMSEGETNTGDKKDDNTRDGENTETSSQSNAAKVCFRQMCSRLKKLCCCDNPNDNDAKNEPETAEISPSVHIPERKAMTKEEKLRECLQKINFQNKSDQEYEDEFNKLPSVKTKSNTISLETTYRSKLEDEGVFPYDENIVDIHGHDGKKLYVNASYIKDKADEKLIFFASAGSNKREDHERLWRLFLETGCRTVVMLDTYGRESLFAFRKNRYWPREGKTDEYDTLSVRCTSRDPIIKGQQIITRYFEIKKGTKTEYVKQLQYTDWPEKGIPRNLNSLLDFLDQVELAHKENIGPLLVHDRCGTGRTGTFIALYILSKEVEDMLASDKEHITDIYSCVENLRNQRVKTVENVGQYKFLHEALFSFVSNMLEKIKDTGTSEGDENKDKNQK